MLACEKFVNGGNLTSQGAVAAGRDNLITH